MAKRVDGGDDATTRDEAAHDEEKHASVLGSLVAPLEHAPRKIARIETKTTTTTTPRQRVASGGSDDPHEGDAERCADLLQSLVGTAHQRDLLLLAARYVPFNVAAQFAARCRPKFTKLPSDVLTIVYSFGNVCEHFRLAQCARLLRGVANLPASSPVAVVVRSPKSGHNGTLPRSLLALRPASLSIHRSCIEHLPQLAVMQSVRALDVVANWHEAFLAADSDIAVWNPLQQFRNLAALGLTIRDWPEAVVPLGAIGAQLELLHIDMCVVHVGFDFSCLARCARLVELRLTDVELTDRIGLKRLAACTPRLVRLRLEWEYESSGQSIDLDFLDAFTQLRRLDVSSADRCVTLPSAMPFLEYASFETKRLASPSGFRDWSSLRSLKLPGDPLPDRQLPASLTHLDASALDATETARLVQTPLPALVRFVLNRRSAPPDAGTVVFQRRVAECCGSSLAIEWVDLPPAPPPIEEPS